MSQLIRPVFIVLLAFCAARGAPAAEPLRPLAPIGWFHVYALDKHTYALSEPKYWQENVSYLLIGRRRALLFDTGPGLYSIKAIVDSLTSLPVIVIPSHLHFDHVGDLPEFTDVRLLDTPALRAQVHDGDFIEPPLQYMLRSSFKYRVRAWIKDGQSLDLGGRHVRLISTPGHTADSVSLIDLAGDRLFIGDLVNRVVTLAAVPGSDVNAMTASLRRLLALSHATAPAYEAHAEAFLTHAQLQQLADGIAQIAAGNATWTPMCLGSTPMRRFSVGEFPVLLPLVDGPAQPPLESATQELNWDGSVCN